MWDWVGGRFSVWSAVGFSAACAIGWNAFEDFLSRRTGRGRALRATRGREERTGADGAHRRLEHELPRRADARVLPYSNALRQLPAYLQQLEMESNGKRVDREGREVDYATAPVVWGGEGTVSQHSFHQLLHQGTQIVPADFIDFGLDPRLSAKLQRPGRRARVRHRRCEPAAPPAISRQPALEHLLFLEGLTPGTWGADRAVRAQGVHAGRGLEHQQLRPVGRRARQGNGKKILSKKVRERQWTRKPSTSASASSSRWWG